MAFLRRTHTLEFSPSDLGRLAYAAYCKSTGGVSLVSGAHLPSFEGLSEPTRVAWNEAAVTIALRVIDKVNAKL